MLEEHIKLCVAPANNKGHELLDELLREIRRVADGLKAQYDYDPDANASAMSHYVSLTREARELVVAMERIRPSEELAAEITTKILSPLVRQTILLIAEEARKYREELATIVDPQEYQAADNALKRMLDKFAARLTNETDDLIERLHKLLASPKKKKSSQPSTPANPSQDPNVH
jgi:hypothetical protein